MKHVLRLEVMLGGQRVGQLAQGQGPGIYFQ